MNTRSNRNQKNNTNTFAQTSRSLVLTAVAVAALNSVALAQTNSSSGINRQSAQQAAQTPAGAQRGTAPSTAAGASVRAATTPGKKSSATTKKTRKASSTAAARRARQTSSQRPIKITIRGDRNDVRQARQQGIQSLQNANAAVAAREAQRAADAEAAANANDQAVANGNNGFPQTNDPSNYGFVPGFGYGNFGNPIASYGYGNSFYGSVPTTQPIQNGVTPYGTSNQTFPSFYTNFGPGIYSTYSTFGPIGPFGF